MTITLSFPPETARGLHERAAASGLTVEGFIRDLVEREVVMLPVETVRPRAAKFGSRGGCHRASPARVRRERDE